MTTITRINSMYNSGGGAYYGYGQAQRQQSNHISIWGEPSLFSSSFSSNNYIGANNGIQGLNFASRGASFVPMDQIMTSPFGSNVDLLGNNNYGFNPFTSSNFNSTSIFSNGNSNIFHRRSSNVNRNGIHDTRRNFLSLTGQHSEHNAGSHSGRHSDNIFRNHADSHHSNNINFKSTSMRTGNFGSQTMSNRSTSIHTPSVDFNTRDINAGNRSISSTNLSGHVDRFKQTNQHIVTPTSNLNKTRQVIDTPTERITRTRTQGTIWV